MKIGLLWFDNDPHADLKTKIGRAVDYYKNKYGETPNLCFVHKSTTAEPLQIGGVTIKPNRSILPNHFWVGVDEAEKRLYVLSDGHDVDRSAWMNYNEYKQAQEDAEEASDGNWGWYPAKE